MKPMNDVDSEIFTAPPTIANRLIFFVLCAAIVLTTLAYGTVHPPLVGLFWISAALIAVLWTIDALLGGKLRFSPNLLQIPLLAAALFGMLQIIPLGANAISLNPYETRLATWHFAALLIYFAALLCFVDTPRRMRFLVNLITIFGFAFALFAILQNLLDPTRIYGVYERAGALPFGSFVNKHNAAAYLEMCAALPLGLLFSNAVEREKRLLYVTAAALIGIALVMSGSRGGLVSFLAMLIFLAVTSGETRTTRGLFIKIGLAAALVAAIVGGTILIGGDSALTRVAESANSSDPTSSRVQIWTTTLEIIKHYPVFGTGWAAFPVAYPQFDPMNGSERVEQAHNDYLQILADAGIVGAIIGAFFVFQLFRAGFRQIESSNSFRRAVAVGALAGCFAVLVHSIFDFVLHTTAVSLLFLALAVLAAINLESAARGKRRRSANVTSIDSKRRAKSSEI